MQEVKFSKGPWAASYMPEEGGDYVITASNGVSVAISIGGTAAEAANARLMSVAPDLYEALEMLLELNDGCVWADEPWQRSFELARAALAKARGEQC